MRRKTMGFKQVFILGLVVVCLCSVLCSCGKPSLHDNDSLVAFVKEIDEDATLDYKSGRPVYDSFRDLEDYCYDANIGGVDCYVVDRYFENPDRKLDLPFSDYYMILTDYTYRLCEDLWDDLRVEYTCVNPFENKMVAVQKLQGLAREPHEIDGRMIPDCVTVSAYEDVVDEEVFNDYWNFYCDLIESMEDYPEFAKLQITVYEENTHKHFTFSDTDDDEYDKEYESYFGQ